MSEEQVAADVVAGAEGAEAADAPDALEAAQAEIVRLTDDVVRLTDELAAERDRALRAVAEAENVRRRLERDKADAVAYAAAGFARDMLGVADNLQRAIAAVPEDASVRGGLEATAREVASIFARHGVSRVDANPGDALDPNKHQAMVEVESELPAGAIVGELQAGYVLKERLLRPALVTVSKGGAQ